MNRAILFLALAALLLAAGCASKASLDAAYDASLQHWRGATRADLEATWGRPMLETPGDGGLVLTWVVRNDDQHDRLGSNGPGMPVVSRTAGSNGLTVITAGPGPIGAASVPITCTTHFALKDGHVVSWKFEGLGCGAPY